MILDRWSFETGHRDYVKAGKYFKLPADQGNAEGQFNSGVCVYHGYGVH
jgi:TPR repeat protein